MHPEETTQTVRVGAVFPGVRLAGTTVAPTCFLISSGVLVTLGRQHRDFLPVTDGED